MFDHLHAMCAYGVRGGIGSLILVLGTRWEWSASRPGCCTPSTHWRGDWVGPRISVDTG